MQALPDCCVQQGLLWTVPVPDSPLTHVMTCCGLCLFTLFMFAGSGRRGPAPCLLWAFLKRTAAANDVHDMAVSGVKHMAETYTTCARDAMPDQSLKLLGFGSVACVVISYLEFTLLALLFIPCLL